MAQVSTRLWDRVGGLEEIHGKMVVRPRARTQSGADAAVWLGYWFARRSGVYLVPAAR